VNAGSTHELKTHPEQFQKVWTGKKKAELRFDDRDFMIGDALVLKEYKPNKREFSGRVLSARISDITRVCHWVPEVDHRWVVLHLDEVTRSNR
jgi:hypothetical protein